MVNSPSPKTNLSAVSSPVASSHSKKSVTKRSPEVAAKSSPLKKSKTSKAKKASLSPVKDMSQHIKEIIEEKSTANMAIAVTKTQTLNQKSPNISVAKTPESKVATTSKKVKSSGFGNTPKMALSNSKLNSSVTVTPAKKQKTPKSLTNVASRKSVKRKSISTVHSVKKSPKTPARSRRSLPNPAVVASVAYDSSKNTQASTGHKSTPHGSEKLNELQSQSASRKRKSVTKFSSSSKLVRLENEGQKKAVRKPTPNRVSQITRRSRQLAAVEYAAGDASLPYLTPDTQPRTRFAGHTPFQTPLASNRAIQSSLELNDTVISSMMDSSAVSEETDADVTDAAVTDAEVPAASKSWCIVM